MNHVTVQWPNMVRVQAKANMPTARYKPYILTFKCEHDMRYKIESLVAAGI